MPQDRLIRCTECRITFLWSAGEQDGGPAPPRCPACRRLAPPPGRQRGLVKWFSRARGYGFVTTIAGDEVFIHKSSLADGQPCPRAGQLVEFGLAHGARGAQAADLVVLQTTSSISAS